MGYNGAVFAGTLGGINVAATQSLNVLMPVLSSVDTSLFSPFGLGSLADNLKQQLASALAGSVSLTKGLANPIDGYMKALAGITALAAQIQAALAALSSGLVPLSTPSIETTNQLKTLSAFASSTAAQLGGLDALMQALKAAKLPAVSFAGSLSLMLTSPGAALVTFEDMTLAAAGAAIAGNFSTGLSWGPTTILPADKVWGVIILTSIPSTWTAIRSTLVPP
jgi:hypothetical protein